MKKSGHLIIGLAILLPPALAQSTIRVSPTKTPILAATLVPQGRNTIYGTVFSDDHRPVADVYVELLDDVSGTKQK